MKPNSLSKVTLHRAKWGLNSRLSAVSAFPQSETKQVKARKCKCLLKNPSLNEENREMQSGKNEKTLEGRNHILITFMWASFPALESQKMFIEYKRGNNQSIGFTVEPFDTISISTDYTRKTFVPFPILNLYLPCHHRAIGVCFWRQVLWVKKTVLIQCH